MEEFRSVMSLCAFGLWMIDLMPKVEMDAGLVSGINEIGNLCYIAFYVYILNHDVSPFLGVSPTVDSLWNPF